MSFRRAGWWAGLVAGIFPAIAIYFGWFTRRIPAVALALWERELRLIPLQLFSFLIVRLKFAAKPMAFWGMLGGLVLVLGVVGAVVAWWAGRRPARLLAGSWVVSSALLTVLTVRPASRYLAERLAADGIRGGSTGSVLAALAAYGAVFAVPFALLMMVTRRGGSAAPSPPGATRRDFLSRVVVALLASAVGARPHTG